MHIPSSLSKSLQSLQSLDHLNKLNNRRTISALLAFALTSYLLISLDLLQSLPTLIRRPNKVTGCRIKHEFENIGKPKCPKPPEWVELDPETKFAPDGPRTFTDGLPLPKAIIFDFDWTLWPYYFDTQVFELPFQMDSKTSIKDSSYYPNKFDIWPDVVNIITLANLTGIKLGIASLARTTSQDLYLEFLKLIPSNATLLENPPKWNATARPLVPRQEVKSGAKQVPMLLDHFDPALIQVFRAYPMRKVEHLRKIKSASGFRGKDILLIDDDINQGIVEGLGVKFHFTGTRKASNHKTFRGPLTWDVIDDGVTLWRTSRELDGEVMDVSVGEGRRPGNVGEEKDGANAAEGNTQEKIEQKMGSQLNAEMKKPG